MFARLSLLTCFPHGAWSVLKGEHCLCSTLACALTSFCLMEQQEWGHGLEMEVEKDFILYFLFQIFCKKWANC